MLPSWISRHFTSPVIATAPECHSLPTFKYESLPANRKCFRVFHLDRRNSGEDPAAENDGSHPQLDGRIRGHLSIVYLDQSSDTRVQYDALSYCWEDPIENSPKSKPNNMIELHQELEDGKRTEVSQFTITSTLSTALRYLRARAGTAGRLPPIFIDQICINQGDSTEKSQQVSLMGDIYRHCTQVVAWLGVATEHTDAFFDFAAQLNHHQCEGLVYDSERTSATISAVMNPGTPNVKFDAEEVLKRDMPQMVALARRYWPSGFPHRGALEVYMRRWFRRIWIIQEGCLPPEIVFLCGARSCSVRNFGTVVNFHLLAKWLWSWRLEGDPTPLPAFPEATDDVSNPIHKAMMATGLPLRILRERWRTWSRPPQSKKEPRSLPGLVTTFNVDMMGQGSWARLGSSMPHDYIYALKGLAEEGDPVAASLVPNYEAPAQDAFTLFARLVIERSLDTVLLSRMETKRFREGLPSWVPDYSSEHLTLPRGYFDGGKPMFASGCPDGDLNKGSIQVDNGSPPNILRAKGILLCEVDRVGVHSMELPPPTAREPRYMHLYLGFHMAFPLPWGSRKYSDTHTELTPLPSTIFSFLREVREFCELAATAAANTSSGHDMTRSTRCIGNSFPNPTGQEGEVESRRRLEEAIWFTTTGGHGLPSNIEQYPLGPPTPSLEGDFAYQQKDEKERPLLGRLLELQLIMDVFPTIVRRRKISLETIASSYHAAVGSIQNHPPARNIQYIWAWFSWLLLVLSTWVHAALVYLAGRVWIEARNVWWCYRFFATYPFVPATSKDQFLWGVFGMPSPARGGRPAYNVGIIQGVLSRHVGRCCFTSAVGHVGLAPAGLENNKQRSAGPAGSRDENQECNELGTRPGDLVVVLLGMTAPIILRPGPTGADPFTYIGEAYCHGFMKGEALRGKDEADMRWFEIG